MRSAVKSSSKTKSSWQSYKLKAFHASFTPSSHINLQPRARSDGIVTARQYLKSSRSVRLMSRVTSIWTISILTIFGIACLYAISFIAFDHTLPLIIRALQCFVLLSLVVWVIYNVPLQIGILRWKQKNR